MCDRIPHSAAYTECYYYRTCSCHVDCKNFSHLICQTTKAVLFWRLMYLWLKYKVVFFPDELALKFSKYLMSGMSDELCNFCFWVERAVPIICGMVHCVDVFSPDIVAGLWTACSSNFLFVWSVQDMLRAVLVCGN